TTVVKSLVNDVIMPPIGLITGDRDFSDLFWVLRVPEGVTVPADGFQSLAAAQAAGAVTLNYGQFFNACFTLLIIAIAMFTIIRTVNRIDAELDERFGEPPPSQEPSDKKCEFCRSTVPFRATRCPQCTSELVVPNVSAANKATE
ncbi:MAG: large-conductance mechanosensitive channel protein MscL, partial [Novipirellula sp. JB048]